MSEQFEDLKTAILTSIENVDQRETAKSVVRYRRLSELLLGLRIAPQVVSSSVAFHTLLEQNGIVKILDARDLGAPPYRGIPARSFFVKDDGTFFETRISTEIIAEYESDWDNFKSMQTQTKEIILDALQEMVRSSPLV